MSKKNAERKIRDQILLAILVLGGLAIALSFIFIRAEDIALADLFDLVSIIFRSVVGIFLLIVLVFVVLFLIHRWQELKRFVK